MKPYLPDINVLIALAWPNHLHHREAHFYLLGLASAHGGVLATLDRAVSALARGQRGAVEIIG
jgi:predicted nucleic acid-binding protein